jgi:hypothetical protein
LREIRVLTIRFPDIFLITDFQRYSLICYNVARFVRKIRYKPIFRKTAISQRNSKEYEVNKPKDYEKSMI